MNSTLTIDVDGYKTHAILGQSGLATTYHASAVDGSPIALKVVRPYLVTDEGLLRRFLDFLRRLTRLADSHINPSTDMGREGPRIWIVSPYQPGGSLRDRMGQPLPLDETVRIVTEAAAGLDAAHQQGFIHGDLKPSNILFSAAGDVVIGDFGMAFLVDGLPIAMRIGLQTPHPEYTSQEQGSGLRLDARSDVYALGAIAYHMLTGRPPFRGDASTVLAKQISQSALTPSVLRPELSPAVDQVLLRALRSNPQARYASAGDFARALAAAALGHVDQVAEPAAEETAPVAAASPWIPPEVASRPLATFYRPAMPARPSRWSDRLPVRLLLSVLLLAGSLGYYLMTQPAPVRAATAMEVVSGAGEWGTLGRDSERSGYDSTHQWDWQGSTMWKTTVGEKAFAPPVVAGGVVYEATWNDGLVALDETSGKILWRVPLDGPMDASPVVTADRIFVGGRSAWVIALDRATGREVWRQHLTNPISGSPALARGVLYVFPADGILYALDAADGRVLWQFNTGSWGFESSSPAVSGGIVAFGSIDMKVYTVDGGTGQQRLAYQTALQVNSSAAIQGDTFYIGASDSVFRALSLHARTPAWEQPLRFWQAQLYIWGMAGPPPPQHGGVWGFRAPRAIHFTTPSLANGTVYVGADNGQLYALNAETGEARWQLNTKQPPTGVVIVGDTAYAVAQDGTVYAVDAASGTVRRTAELHEKVTAPPVAGANALYVVTEAGTVYALR